MRSVQVVEAKARFSALLAAVESGETVAITRHGRVVARLVPDAPRSAASVFQPCWDQAGDDAAPHSFDVTAPLDKSAEPAPKL